MLVKSGMARIDDDIVADILRRVVEAAGREGGFSDNMARTIEEQVRGKWGGDRHYVPRTSEDRRIERDNKILTLWDGGLRDLKVLATRFDISERHARRIVMRSVVRR